MECFSTNCKYFDYKSYWTCIINILFRVWPKISWSKNY